MSHRLHHLDVFSATPLAGNPLGVLVVDGRTPSDPTLAALARELNLSETVVILPELTDGTVPVRIFTPRAELPFAGHPLVGAAWLTTRLRGTHSLRLAPPGAVVDARLDPDGSAWIEGPAATEVPERALLADARLLAANGLDASALLEPSSTWDIAGTRHRILLLRSDIDISAVRPDLGVIAELGTVGCYLARCDGQGKARSRLFAPGLGITEDPATGSAALCLHALLERRGELDDGRLTIDQGQEIGQPSSIRVVTAGDRRALGGAVVELFAADVVLQDVVHKP